MGWFLLKWGKDGLACFEVGEDGLACFEVGGGWVGLF